MTAKASPPRGPRKRVRRRLLIDFSFQLRAFLPVLLFVLLYAALLVLVVLVPFYRAVGAEPDIAARAILRAHMGEIQLRLWPLVGVAGLVAAYVSFRWSLHAAGPMYRLHRVLTELAEGEHRPLRFRRRDEFRIFEEDVGLLNQKMKLIASRNRDILYAVYTHVKKLSDRLAADEVIPRADLEEAVTDMRMSIEKAPEISLAARR